jgi:hypothetical protein
MASINIQNPQKFLDEAFKDLNKNGFYCLESAIDINLQEEFMKDVTNLLRLKGNRYFAVTDAMNIQEMSFKKLSENDELVTFLTSLSSLALKREVVKSDSLNVLRILTGKKTDNQSFKFHYDAYALTALIPIAIPNEEIEKSGHLVSFPNLRKFRFFFLFNLMEKMLLQNTFTRKILARVVCSNPHKYSKIMKPGNIYIFWGYRTLHANLPVDPSLKRATLLYHFGDVHPKSKVNSLIKYLRRSYENVNLNK